MRNIFELTKRNCRQYFRSKQVIFSSLISSIIIIALYFLFIANLYSQGFNDAAGTFLTQKQIDAMIYMQMIMGVLMINSISLSMGMFSFMARDFETRKTQAFLLTRAKPVEITLSYLISALLISLLLNGFTLAISLVIIGASTGVWLGVGALFAVLGALLTTTIVSCAVMLLVLTLVRSSLAAGIINGILGTILGFLCGIYMPYVNMPKGASYIGSFLPFTHLTIWLKQIALGDLCRQFGVNDYGADMIHMWFSAENVGLCGANVPLWVMILLSLTVAVICFVVSMFLIKKLFSDKNGGRLRAAKE